MNRSIAAASVVVLSLFLAVSALSARELSLADRVAARKAIEQVYWNHRIWPKENPTPKPPLSAVLSDEAIRARVEDDLKKSNALEIYWGRGITAEQLQAELDRMSRDTRDGAMLQELFHALGDDPYVIAETLARQTLVGRLIHNWYASDTRFHGALKAKAEAALAACADVACMKSMGGEYRETTPQLGTGPDSLPVGRMSRLEETSDAFAITAVLSRHGAEMTTASVTFTKTPFESWWTSERSSIGTGTSRIDGAFALPAAPVTACTNDTWASFGPGDVVTRTAHTAVWTGSEMIVWGGADSTLFPATNFNSGARYSPSTDSWTPTSVGANVPAGRHAHTAVWTGTEMLVWGGLAATGAELASGGRYDPSTDSWRATAMGTNVPAARHQQTAVWTGTEMIVWGGIPALGGFLSSGGRYNPSTDSWAATSIGANVPAARVGHTAVWTGSAMVVWGGYNGSALNTGGRYSPSTDTWTPTSLGANVPTPRNNHSAVWTGTQMIVWGGAVNTGGRYSPSTDSWVPTSTGANVPAARLQHTAVWTGSTMIIWGGYNGSSYLNSGGRYNPSTDSWLGSSLAPLLERTDHTAVWTGTEMIVWGGSQVGGAALATGARYNPSSDSWVATSRALVPIPRDLHTAVWTGSELIVWGGTNGSAQNTGGVYVPSTGSWTPTSTGAGVPAARYEHTAVWTGTEMIVWGGLDASWFNTGGRYDAASDTWIATSASGSVPSARERHSAVWTGTQMIVWGGYGGSYVNTGGRYIPSADSWTATSTGANVPAGRYGHVAVWTGAEMVVWGGFNGTYLSSGGRYVESTNSWIPMSAGAMAGAYDSTAVWTGSEMIVWGGYNGSYLDSGGRYRPSSDAWTPTSTGANVPVGRSRHAAVWTGMEAIVWGGWAGAELGSGGRYCPSADSWTATSSGANVPASRYYHSATWLSGGTEMIVWGGTPFADHDGGRYCARPTGVTYYRDADGDGFGDANAFVTLCGGPSPSGYVSDNTDCNDGNAAIHPGAPEINDGIDNQCPGGRGYGSRDELEGIIGFFTVGDKTKLSWTDASGASAYDVARSTSRYVTNECHIVSTNLPSISDAEVPPPQSAFYYLARAAAPWTGSWGAQSTGIERSVCTACVYPTDQCDDANACTVGDSCPAGTGSCVSGTAPNCDDGNPCTDDSCNPARGCVHTDNTSSCDDGNACTDDACNPATGCTHSNNSGACNDGNVCTDDSCNPATGCVFSNNTASCDDGSPCTTGDVCSAGSCAGTLTTPATHLVISQIQTNGDGATPATDEFVEIYNPTNAAISLTNYRLHLVINTFPSISTFAQNLGVGTVPAHGWLLVARSGYNGPVAADIIASASFTLSSTTDSLMLVNSMLSVTSCNPGGLVDKVAYGGGTCVEGTSATAPAANNSILRRPGGTCGNGTDAGNNVNDFVSQAPATPRNSASPPQP